VIFFASNSTRCVELQKIIDWLICSWKTAQYIHDIKYTIGCGNACTVKQMIFCGKIDLLRKDTTLTAMDLFNNRTRTTQLPPVFPKYHHHDHQRLTSRHENTVRKGPHPFYRTKAMLDGSQLSKWHLVDIRQFWHMAVLFIYIGRMPCLAPTLDNADRSSPWW